jgi:diguanylate cyclase (GGDEF)-like protein
LETCHREFSKAARARQSIGILSIDIDHFKKCNDNHGHDAGDMILRAFGECLESSFRGEDVACRLGGEEFVVVMPGASAESAVSRAEELKAKVESLTIRYLGRTLPKTTISVGVAAFPEFGDTPEAVIKAADEALYRAKEQGRNRVERACSVDSSAAAVSLTHPGALQRMLGVTFQPTGTECGQATASVGDAA